ncbi:DUF349 domain-containing protein [Flavicella sp.]|uniref:DUF349 domain-containing protein n=1 Tax=Flavicella sp. TaxID=2957742 RepID=UPI00261F58F1|nr:DUF349 domain-containing protein [Flavicella sp.]MDG1805102.1 DUF349 domain-containing protein [Flavicella sp.]MDG2280382.1 DUF349 domain-containing protein [Flavicella sp.]
MLDAVNSNSEDVEKSTEDQKQTDSSTNTEAKEVEKNTENASDETTAALEKVVSSIEEKVAADAEKVEEKEVVPTIDYASLSMEEIVKEIKNLVKDEKIQAIKTSVESLRKSFDTKFSELLASKKAAFLAEGGESIDFHFSSPVKVEFNEIINEYRTKRNKHYSELDSQLKENLDKRLATIEALKGIIEKADSKTMHKEFKELQETWKSIGPVPRTKYNNTWRNYHHHVERFYDLLHMNNDLRELDFKHNLEEKIKIVEKAFELTLMEDVSKAFKGLQELHKAWKEDIGPVSREFREEIWQKFSEATKIIHDKRDKYFDEQKSKYQENIQKKLEVIAALDKFDVSKNKTHSDWQRSIKDFEAQREVFFTIGKVPRNKSQKIWDQLKAVTKGFNHAKNQFYKELNSVQHSNLEKKTALLELAKSLKDSDDFKSVTGQMKKIQADWKTIGHVPRKHSDKIWKEFKDACNHYFDRVHQIQDNGSNEELEALATKKDFLSQILGVIGNTEITLEEVKAYMQTWKNIGRVPRKDKQIEADFNSAIEKLFAQLAIEGAELQMLKYKMQIDTYLTSNNSRKIESEVQFVRKKIDEITKGIQQLDNNISFIANANEDNPLVKNVRNSIAEQTKGLKVWKDKLAYLRSVN